MKHFVGVLMVFLTVTNAFAALRSETVNYKQGDVTLEGYLAYDDATKDKRPGVLVVHEWKGLGPYVKSRAEQLASMGYVAFAPDIYGKGIRPQTNEEAGKQATIYKSDRGLLRARIKAGLNALENHPLTDVKRIAAIGYCFGGTTVLELARSGADVAGVVSFHGGLSSPTPDDARNIKARVLTLHGADDPYVKSEEVLAFQDEMRKGNVDWRLISYGGAVHSFTNFEAGNDSSKGAAYNEKADKRSWEDMKLFFEEIFK